MLAYYKWRFFILAVLITFPIYFVFFFPVIFKKIIELHFFDTYEVSMLELMIDFSFLFAAYAFPNIFLSLFRQNFISLKDIRRNIFIFISFMIIGQLLFNFGFNNKLFYYMILGRFFYGAGAEIIFTLINSILLKYFKKESLKVIMASLFAISNIFGSLSFLICPYILTNYSIEKVLSLNEILIIISFSAGLIMIILDFYIEKTHRQINILLANINKNLLKVNNSAIFLNLLNLNKNHYKLINFDYKLFLYPVFLFSSVLLFNNYGSCFLIEKIYFDLPMELAHFYSGMHLSGFWLISCFCSSLTTFYIDFKDTKPEFLMICSIFTIIFSHIFNLFFSPLIGIILLGIGYGVGFSLFMYFNEKSLQSQEIIFSGINLGLVVGSYIIAVLINKYGYFHCELFVLCLSIISLFIFIKMIHDQAFVENFTSKKKLSENSNYSSRDSMIELEEINK